MKAIVPNNLMMKVVFFLWHIPYRIIFKILKFAEILADQSVPWFVCTHWCSPQQTIPGKGYGGLYSLCVMFKLGIFFSHETNPF